MIYFNKSIQNKVHELLYNSLETGSFLALGKKESIRFSQYEAHFSDFDGGNKIYRKID